MSRFKASLRVALAFLPFAAGACGAEPTSDLGLGAGSGANPSTGPRFVAADAGPAGEASCKAGLTRACYTGPAGTRGVGICRDGTQTCGGSGEFGSWGPCLGSVTPSDTPTGTCQCVPGATVTSADGGPGFDSSPKLCGDAHSECDCGLAGGELVDIGEGCRICRFAGATCPGAGAWTGYKEWRTTGNGSSDCGGVGLIASTGPGGAADNCPAQVPAVQTSSGSYLLSCDREASFCCGTPPGPIAIPLGKAWSPHTPATTSFTQGFNVCGCACGPEHCQTTTATCEAPTVQIGCR